MAKKAFVYDGSQWVDIAQSTADLSNYANMTTTPISGFRNVITNGDMRVKQRGSFTTTINTHQFTTDRWWVFSGASTTGAPSYITSTGLTNFPNALRAQRQSGQTGTGAIVMGQTIESADIHQIRGKTITVSFWARAGANYSNGSNHLNVFLVQGTGVDQGTVGAYVQSWTGISLPVIGTATLTTSWQKFTYTYTVLSTTNEASLWFYQTPSGTAGANDWFDITGVQLELGSVATPFENRPYSVEFQACQRHFYNNANQYGPASSFGLGNAYHGPVVFPTTMRAIPTVTLFSSSGSANQATFYPGTVIGTPNIEALTTNTFVINLPGGGSYNGVLYSLIVNAEL